MQQNPKNRNAQRRALLKVIQFELRYQLRSPFFLGALLLFALIHFMAFTGVINLDVGALVAINSGYAVLQNELVFFILGMLPVVAFVTTAITRNFEYATASLVCRTSEDGYEVTIEVTAKQFAADGSGKESEEPLDSVFDVAVFTETNKPLEGVTPLYIKKHRLRSGRQTLTVRTIQRPGIVALDPFHKRIERSAGITAA